MIDQSEFITIGADEAAGVVGGDWPTVLIMFVLNNFDSLVQGIKDGYAAGSPK